MAISKAWNWSAEKNSYWLEPSEDVYYLAYRWKKSGFSNFLDFGCGLGRHSLFFAERGFSVKAFDLSQEAIARVDNAKGTLNIETRVADMCSTGYDDEVFDCLLAYHVISHTDSNGIRDIIAEIKRILHPGGEFYLSLCSKDTWSFTSAGYPMLDENTVVKTCEGPENGVPHFYVDMDDAEKLFEDFDIIRIRHVDDCYFNGARQNSKHYFILARKRGANAE